MIPQAWTRADVRIRPPEPGETPLCDAEVDIAFARGIFSGHDGAEPLFVLEDPARRLPPHPAPARAHFAGEGA